MKFAKYVVIKISSKKSNDSNKIGYVFGLVTQSKCEVIQ